MKLDPATRIALEALYSVLLSTIVLVAKLLEKECPVATRENRRQNRPEVLQ